MGKCSGDFESDSLCWVRVQSNGVAVWDGCILISGSQIGDTRPRRFVGGRMQVGAPSTKMTDGLVRGMCVEPHLRLPFQKA